MLTSFAELTPAAAVSLGLIPIGVIGLVLAFAPADAAWFDPRPMARAAGDRLLVEVVRTKHAARELPIAVAALLILTIPTGDYRS